MTGIDMYMFVTAVLRGVSIYCITQAAIHFNNPWLLLIYLAVPFLGYPGVPVPTDKKNSKASDACE